MGSVGVWAAVLFYLHNPVGSGRQAPAPQPSSGVSRWVRVQAATIATRYRWIENSEDTTIANQLQYSGAFRAALLFDPQARFRLVAGVATGSAFTSGWNATGIGTGGVNDAVNLKHLYLWAMPLNGLEASYGSLEPARGEATEVTTFDNDGYVFGGRVSVRKREWLFVDEASVTVGHVGDLLRPGVFDRTRRYDSTNYQQYLVRRQFGRVAISGEYSRLNGAPTLRQALRVSAPELRVVDSLRFEQYEGLDDGGAYGFLVYAEKAVTRRISAGGGFADIDPAYGILNADRFSRGRRAYAIISARLARGLTLQPFVTYAFANDFPVSNRTRLDIVLSYDMLAAFGRP